MALITRKFCPQCGGNDVTLVERGATGLYLCASCGYRGPISEKELLGREGSMGEGELKK